ASPPAVGDLPHVQPAHCPYGPYPTETNDPRSGHTTSTTSGRAETGDGSRSESGFLPHSTDQSKHKTRGYRHAFRPTGSALPAYQLPDVEHAHRSKMSSTQL